MPPSNSKKILFYFRNDKINALKNIEISIEEWNVNNVKKKIFFNYFFKRDYRNLIHWEHSGRFSSNYNIYLLWSGSIIKTLSNVEKKNVPNALHAIKYFYSKISSIKPDLSNPDILNCYNSTAVKNNLKVKKINLKEHIEVDVLDPFGDVTGLDKMKIEKTLIKYKSIALNDLDYSLQFFDQINVKNDSRNSKYLKKPKNFIQNKNFSFQTRLIWNEIEIISSKSVLRKNVRKKLLSYKKIIKSLNVSRPNTNDLLIKEIYKISLNIKSQKQIVRIYFNKIKNIFHIFSKLIKFFNNNK